MWFDVRAGLLRTSGALRMIGWTVVLGVVVSPWRDLGGLVGERLRWLEWFVLGSGLAAGCTAGEVGRELLRRGTVASFSRLPRPLIYPAVGLAAASMVALQLTGRPDHALVTCTGLLAYAAGVDVALVALPQLEGRSVRSPEPLECVHEEEMPSTSGTAPARRSSGPPGAAD